MDVSISRSQRPQTKAGERKIENKVGAFAMLAFRLRQALTQPGTYVGLLGIISMVLLWYVLTELLALPRFNKLPGPVAVWKEFTSRTPTY